MTSRYDFIVIGGGSGGIAAARRAASHGAKCLLIEQRELGGTCVNRGCVPKKVMWYAADLVAAIAKAPAFGIDVTLSAIDWSYLVAQREAYIDRLNEIYANNLDKSGVTVVAGVAAFVSADTVIVNEQHYQAPHILIATGSTPQLPEIPGSEHAITSDGFFALSERPQRVAVVGAGYIGVELAGVLAQLGSDVDLLIRHDVVLNRFPAIIAEQMTEILCEQGITIHRQMQPTQLTRLDEGRIQIQVNHDTVLGDYDCVLMATGRIPNTQALQLERAAVAQEQGGFIAVDEAQNTSVSGIYAVGDVTNQAALTPVAIKAGRLLAERLFNDNAQARLDTGMIPSVVFTHPPIGSVGISLEAAVAEYGEAAIDEYVTRFKPMLGATGAPVHASLMQLVVHKATDRVLGCHLIDQHADEILQGFAVAMSMGATKQDFDNTIAIHPTSAEELVTLS